MPRGIAVDVVLAWPRRHELRRVALGEGATVGDAVDAAGFEAGAMEAVVALAVHGERASRDTPLRDGDRVELLRPLQADPKDARRRRAERQRQR